MHTAPVLVHTHPVRIYWEDTDAGGIVFYANYLKFFERARTEWLRALGVDQQRLMTEGVDDSGAAIFVVTDTRTRHLAPARLDDLLQVTVALRGGDIGSASLVITQQALREGVLLAEGEIRIGCVAPGTLRPRRIPAELRQRLRALTGAQAAA